jgi:Fe-S cluster biogenesis protein NfuA
MIQKVPVSVYAEMTPNPSVMKFVANKRLIGFDSIELKNIEEAANCELASKLFHFPFVKEVFVSGNFIAITKFNIVEWDDVAMEIRTFMTEYLQSHEGFIMEEPNEVNKEEVVEGETTAEVPNSSNVQLPNIEDLGDVEKRIVEILDEYVKPAVQGDGGNIAFISYEDKKVNVLLQGACSGCPSSTATLKSGIQNILQQMLPTLVDDVVAING